MPDAPSVITLTTIPPRFGALGPTLASLVAQDVPAPVELWIPETYARFPKWDGSLPTVPAGVTIRRCARDWGPATKVVPAALERAGEAVDLLFCDDDSIYAPDWHRRFKALRRERPGDALAALGRHLPGRAQGPRLRDDRMPRMRRLSPTVVAPIFARQGYGDGPPVALVGKSGYADLLGGWCGVMVRPSFFAPQLAEGPGRWWPVDDVWLSGMLELGGTAIWVDASILPPGRRNVGGTADLTRLSVEGDGRVALDTGCAADLMSQHGIWTAESLGMPG
ncbi:glycosyltransferase family A protein [Pararhodobacter zhoushanensis]|uniref:glycosyltransferase family A protein n=1 Tax=Pararhodobacter zhoushanensis TaxID=2479545 RepID=UPI000F8EB0D0|nr:glycosyltransferase family A protein [Pararhodobacter zhoushanensis]